jgi:hypothetical protein
VIKTYTVKNDIRVDDVNQYNFAKLTRVLFDLDIACIFLYDMNGDKLSIEL